MYELWHGHELKYEIAEYLMNYVMVFFVIVWFFFNSDSMV